MSMTGKIKVKYIKENKYNLRKGIIYDAYIVKGAVKNKENMISVIDDIGEEYVYPKEWFEILDYQEQ